MWTDGAMPSVLFCHKFRLSRDLPKRKNEYALWELPH